MRLLFISLTLALFAFASCKSDKDTNNEDKQENTSTTTSTETETVVAGKSPDGKEIVREKGGTDKFAELKIERDENNLTGHYVGFFGPNKINLTLLRMEGDSAFGFSTVSGNHRPLAGTFLAKEASYSFFLNEPGDDEWDGRFTFKVRDDGSQLSGRWTPYKNKENPERYKKKEYQLFKQEFVFDTTSGEYPEASVEWLYPEDLFNLKQEELRLMRSEIYARRGYSFKKKDMRAHFDAQDWYMPMTTDVRDLMTDKEWGNIQLIKEVEEYGDEWYDVFGR